MHRDWMHRDWMRRDWLHEFHEELRRMRFSRYFALALTLGSIPAISGAQKPKNDYKVGHSRLAGKGTPADLSHHRDNSAMVLRQNGHGSAADLNRIEQQSLRAEVGASKPARVRSAGVPKPGATKVDKGVPINFPGRAPAHNLTTTRSTGKATGALPAKPH
jgi:hypothetical protein